MTEAGSRPLLLARPGRGRAGSPEEVLALLDQAIGLARPHVATVESAI